MLLLGIPAIFMSNYRYLANADVLINRNCSRQHFIIIIILETLLAILTINKFDDIITNCKNLKNYFIMDKVERSENNDIILKYLYLVALIQIAI